jgi:hypothetical protein
MTVDTPVRFIVWYPWPLGFFCLISGFQTKKSEGSRVPDYKIHSFIFFCYPCVTILHTVTSWVVKANYRKLVSESCHVQTNVVCIVTLYQFIMNKYVYTNYRKVQKVFGHIFCCLYYIQSHNMTEILLKVALNTINQTKQFFNSKTVSRGKFLTFNILI